MAIRIPQGTPEFREAVQRLQNATNATREEKEAIANKCCSLCTCRTSYDQCDECYIGKVAELADSYKAKANTTSLGMYTSGITRTRGPDGKERYSYTHNNGG